MKHGIRNQSLFEAYLEYCFFPRHPIGEQLLGVRRDKRERTFSGDGRGEVARDEQEGIAMKRSIASQWLKSRVSLKHAVTRKNEVCPLLGSTNYQVFTTSSRVVVMRFLGALPTCFRWVNKCSKATNENPASCFYPLMVR